MLRAALIGISLCVTSLPLAAPAEAQFLGLGRKKSDDSDGERKCDEGKRAGASILGGVLGGLASRSPLGRSPVGSIISSNLFSDVLTDAIACRLDKDEQKKAAKASEDAVERGTVGSSSTWQSTTRQNVTGTSTVVAQNVASDGTRCMNVTDVIIVEGEETKVSKKMCRGPGQSKYVVAQV